jgi:hypothetical protein
LWCLRRCFVSVCCCLATLLFFSFARAMGRAWFAITLYKILSS